jgi:signal transduction histidine kinase
MVDALEVPWVRIADEGGLVLAEAGVPPADLAAARFARAPMSLDGTEPWVHVGVPEEPAWNDGDAAVLDMMALLAGTVLRDAREVSRASGRADRLDRTNRIQRDFLRGVSHNLRSPLATIELAAADLAELPDPFVAMRAAAIRGQGQRLARLVDQVLMLSRLESGALHVAADPVALAPVARRMARELALDDRVRVIDAPRGAIAVADDPAVEQIIWVLLDNASRYALDSEIRVDVRIGAPDAEAPRRIVLAVEDDGPGIPPRERQAVFRRFTRGSTAGAHTGTGLGLGVARGLARAMQGDLRYAVAASGGARFELSLPLAETGDGPSVGESDRTRPQQAVAGASG